MADHLVRALVKDHSVRVVAAISTEAAREAARRHQVVAGGAVALGRVSTAALLLATLTKGGERVTLQISGDGPLGLATADGTDAGDVRAYLARPETLVAGGTKRRVALGDAIGRRGVVNVLRDLGLRETYTGQAPIVTGEIDEDVENYLRLSEQIDSALGCEAVLGDGLELAATGGVLVQCLPGAEESPIVREAQHRMRTGALYDALAGGPESALELARAVIDPSLELELLDTRPIQFRCRCSAERVSDMLALLGAADLDAMIREDGGAEVVCNFCGETYRISKDQLERLRGHTHGTA
jgi:molecular chaperone Hsp33